MKIPAPSFSVSKKRDEVFDIIKGIAILLMVLGHSLPSSKAGNYIHNFIYSFHMPLFFIVSGYFHKQTTLSNQSKRDFKTLIIPYLFTTCLLMLCGTFLDFYKNITFPNETLRWFKIAFYASYNPIVSLGNWIGPIWFLLALFWCRLFFVFLFSENRKYNIISFILLPVFVSYIFKFIYIPLYVLQGLIALIFYYIGYCTKEINLLHKKCSIHILLLIFIVWVYCILFSHIDMQSGYYDNFIINVAGAFSGFYSLYVFSRFLEKKLPKINKVLAYIGRNSIVILCFHSIDYSMTYSYSINPWGILIQKVQTIIPALQGHYYRYFIGGRFLYSLFAVAIIPRIHIFKRIFVIK